MRRSVATGVALVLLACGSAAAAPGRGRLVISGSTYRLVVSKGEIEIFSRGTRLLHGPLIFDGGVTHRWNAKSSTLTLAAPSSRVTLHARPTYFDLRLTLTNRGNTRTAVPFPAGLVGDRRRCGLRAERAAGSAAEAAILLALGGNVDIYPSRWAFGD